MLPQPFLSGCQVLAFGGMVSRSLTDMLVLFLEVRCSRAEGSVSLSFLSVQWRWYLPLGCYEGSASAPYF